MNDIFQSYHNILENIPSDYSDLKVLLQNSLSNGFDKEINGNLKKWLPVYENLMPFIPSDLQLGQPILGFGVKNDIPLDHTNDFIENLKKLHPWRKGPFSLFGINIDSEWRSDLKWARIQKHISSLKNRRILDIGCGNGYYMFRMLAEGAKMVVGIDPGLLSIIQFKIFQFYADIYLNNYKLNNQKKYFGIADIFPLGIDDIPSSIALFQTIFSMGVLYHRKEPIEHLKKIFSLLEHNGEIVLETIILPGEKNEVLHPENRYAQMRNVWNIPSIAKAIEWLKNAGFVDIKVIDRAKTTFQEQRKTDWMQFHSLQDFLDENDYSKTVEGYPAPHRGVFIARKI